MDPIARINHKAPALTLIDLDGHPCGLEQADSGLLILNFWSAECQWSERADAILANLQGEWGEGVTIWSIAPNANEARDQITVAAEERQLRVFLDQDHATADRYGAVTTPHFYLLDEERTIRYSGALDDTTFRQKEPTRHYLADAVQALRVGRLPEPQETNGYGCAIVRFDL